MFKIEHEKPELYRGNNICKLLRKNFEQPFRVDHFINKQEHCRLIEILCKSKECNFNYTPGAIIKNFSWSKISILLADKIKNIIGDFKFSSGSFFSTTRPYHPHVDMGKDKLAIPFKVILIPISIFPVLGSSTTVFFNQRFLGPAANFFFKTKFDKPVFNNVITDYKNIDFINLKKPFPKEDYKAINHIKYELLEGFTLDTQIDWKIGSAIIFDRTQIHCSSNFINTAVLNKCGLSIFTDKVI